MESGVTVEFSIAPKDSEIPPESAIADLIDQIQNAQSELRKGKLGGFFVGASLKPIRGQIGTVADLSEVDDGSSLGSPRKVEAVPEADVSCSEMAEKCRSLQQRLKLKEKELLDVGASQQSRIRDLETLFKDREHLSQHAKDMWMKESGRATKLAEALEEAESKTKDLENRLKDLSEMYNEASQEVRQLKHWFSSQDGYIPSSVEKCQKNGYGIPQTSSNLNGFDLPLPSSRRMESPRDPFPSSSTLPDLPDRTRSLRKPEAESNHDRFRHLCLVNDSILYEDDVMQIGIKSSYRDLEGEVFVYFGNKHSSALQSLSINLFTKESDALKVTWTTAPQIIQPKQQICQRLNICALAPFSEEPSMRVQFLLEDGTPRRIQSRLPICVGKFIRPCETITTQEYLTLWREIEFLRNEISAVCNVSSRFDGRLASLAKCLTLGGALKLLPGVDANPDNFVLVGRWPGDFPSTVLVRIEVGSGGMKGKARIAVRSNSLALAQAVCNQSNIQVSVVSNEAC